jgi:hypothetical protein
MRGCIIIFYMEKQFKYLSNSKYTTKCFKEECINNLSKITRDFRQSHHCLYLSTGVCCWPSNGKFCKTHVNFFTHSRIPIIWHPLNQVGAKLSNIPDYQTVPTLWSQPSEYDTCQLFLFHHTRTLLFNIIGPVMGFLSKHTVVNH